MKEDIKALRESHAELERALLWAMRPAQMAMEDHRLTRLQAGHDDIKAVRLDGSVVCGLWQEEQDDINRAEAALTRARAIRERIDG